MKKFIQSAFATMAIASSVSVLAADDQSNVVFDQGSVIIYCNAPDETEQLDTSIFEAAFPKWMSALQVHANEGRIARAHYLNELKQGIFIVVLGATVEEASSNATLIENQTRKIMLDAVAEIGDAASGFSQESAESACQRIDIGPVAVLPY